MIVYKNLPRKREYFAWDAVKKRMQKGCVQTVFGGEKSMRTKC